MKIKRPKTQITITAGWLLIAFIPAVEAQSLIANGGFEEPSLGPGNSYSSDTPTGWSGGYQLIAGDAGFPDSFPQPFEGHQYEDFGANSGDYSFSQTFTCSAVGTYLLEWEENAVIYLGTGLASYSVTVASLLGGQVAYVSFDAGNLGNWEAQSLQFPLLPGDYTLTFGRDGSAGIFVDSVSLAAVPEPEAYASVAGIALLGMALWRRRTF